MPIQHDFDGEVAAKVGIVSADHSPHAATGDLAQQSNPASEARKVQWAWCEQSRAVPFFQTAKRIPKVCGLQPGEPVCQTREVA